MWTGGVKNCSSVDNRRAIEQVAEVTGLRVEQVKNWVNNRKRRERSAAGQQLKRSRVATSPRKQTGYTCFRTYYMKDAKLDRPKLQAELRDLLNQKWRAATKKETRFHGRRYTGARTERFSFTVCQRAFNSRSPRTWGPKRSRQF
ncbi:hypothetical protein SKAU_G00135840 [Synaphobranchus kaupii]|uniref:Homeobox domain-containing protein n=1 Tax=Synaphobranchus kaupii TaxID=118154 RepID=A0A9Q1FRI1_SYNKA|nr:hypothetical protein SKAU_G00135840 [Synaphobranchus kaupii]